MTTPSVHQFMSHDHDRLDEIFSKVRTTKDSNIEEALSLFKTFKEGLEQHIVWEEEMLFPKFEEKTGFHGTGPTEVMRQEHRMIKQHLSNIDGLLSSGNPAIDSEADAMLRILSVHNEKEENILYPMIDKVVDHGDKEKMIKDMEQDLNK